jgi:CelD/BcsL family acetyltransferase involved in cellulose biosynthesis
MSVRGLDAIAGRRAPTAEQRGGARPAGFSIVRAERADEIAREWGIAADAAVGDNPFFRPEFAAAAMEHLGVRVAIAAVSGHRRALSAVAPFVRTRLGRIAPAVRLWSHAYAPLGEPVVAAGSLPTSAEALIEGLAPAGSGSSLIVPDLPLDGAVAKELAASAQRSGRPVDVIGCHQRAILDHAGDGSAVDVRAGLPLRRRKEYGRQMRRLGESGAMVIEAFTGRDETVAAFEDFMALEAAGWKGRRGTALLARAETAAFARGAIADLASVGLARIDAITIDRRPIAMLVTLFAGATAFTWKIAYHEGYARFSPGAQLMIEAGTALLADGTVKRVDSCAGADHPMIDHLWPGRMRLGTMVIGPPGGSVLHRAGLLAARAEIAARATLKRYRRPLPG